MIAYRLRLDLPQLLIAVYKPLKSYCYVGERTTAHVHTS